MKINVLILMAAACLILFACGGGKTNNNKTEKIKDTTAMNEQKKPENQQQPVQLTNVTVLMETTEGNMKIKLYDETPLHRDNFVKLVKSGFYNGLIFHRVIKGFMIQGGDPMSKNPTPNAEYGTGGPGYTIPAEFNSKLIHKKGALAAARTNNPEKASSGSQFYIVQGEKANISENLKNGFKLNYTPEQIEAYKTIGGTPTLDGEYTVYGEVIEGLDVIDKIANTKTKPSDRPLKDVIINKITIVE
jgi:peptidyl-prolyl cis-trans isomerase B (cyclophilin B)